MRASLLPLSGSPASRHIFRASAGAAAQVDLRLAGRIPGGGADRGTGGHGDAALRAEFVPAALSWPLAHTTVPFRTPSGSSDSSRHRASAGTLIPVARIAARAWSISICIRPRSVRVLLVRSSSGVSGIVSGVTRPHRIGVGDALLADGLAGLRVDVVLEDLRLAVAPEVALAVVGQSSLKTLTGAPLITGRLWLPGDRNLRSQREVTLMTSLRA